MKRLTIEIDYEEQVVDQLPFPQMAAEYVHLFRGVRRASAKVTDLDLESQP